MAPIKFEKNIKDKLEQRTIDPSTNAWSKLSDKLDEHEEGTNSKMIWWFAIAASLVGVFLVATIFFKNKADQTILPITVDTPVEKSGEIKVELTEELEKSKAEAIAETEIKSEAPLVKKVKNKEPEVHSSYNIKESSTNALVENTVKDPKIGTYSSNISDFRMNGKNFEQPIASNTQFENENTMVTDSEIEALLESAKKELLANKIQKEQSKSVDANSLLQDIETDLDETFRDKVFNTLVWGYNSVRTAVALRND